MMKIDTISIGDVFGLLTVVGKKDNQTVVCRCKCGTEKEVNLYKLLSKHTRSCGRKHTVEIRNTHGMAKTRIYAIHRDMKLRCFDENIKEYQNYGGRGISVCDEWCGESGFINFHKWAMENGYSDDLTLDRIDVNGNYEPSNCRWATRTMQQNNMRSNRIIEFNGESHTVAEWIRIFGADGNRFRHRLQQAPTETVMLEFSK